MEGEEKSGILGWKRCIYFVYGLFGILFLPVLFCVIFIGNNMDYYEIRKQGVLLPNIALCAMAFSGGYCSSGCRGFLRNMN